MQIYTIPFAAKKSGDSFSVCLAVDRLWERVDECRNISKQREVERGGGGGTGTEPEEDSSVRSEGHCAKAERAGSEWAQHQSPNGTMRRLHPGWEHSAFLVGPKIILVRGCENVAG